MIKEFIKKPKNIKAVQWTGDNIEEITQFVGTKCMISEKIFNGETIKILEFENPTPPPSIFNENKDYLRCLPDEWVVCDTDDNYYYVINDRVIKVCYIDVTNRKWHITLE